MQRIKKEVVHSLSGDHDEAFCHHSCVFPLELADLGVRAECGCHDKSFDDSFAAIIMFVPAVRIGR